MCASPRCPTSFAIPGCRRRWRPPLTGGRRWRATPGAPRRGRRPGASRSTLVRWPAALLRHACSCRDSTNRQCSSHPGPAIHALVLPVNPVRVLRLPLEFAYWALEKASAACRQQLYGSCTAIMSWSSRSYLTALRPRRSNGQRGLIYGRCWSNDGASRPVSEPCAEPCATGALLDRWVAAQVSTLHSWAERLLDQESWQPLSRAKGCARRVQVDFYCMAGNVSSAVQRACGTPCLATRR